MSDNIRSAIRLIAPDLPTLEVDSIVDHEWEMGRSHGCGPELVARRLLAVADNELGLTGGQVSRMIRDVTGTAGDEE